MPHESTVAHEKKSAIEMRRSTLIDDADGLMNNKVSGYLFEVVFSEFGGVNDIVFVDLRPEFQSSTSGDAENRHAYARRRLLGRRERQ